ncbi:MAG: tRNA uridine-5-carboxymethylaminomethyl(34) synthesis GTPase MnmE [Clostridium sp.]|nr:tRNA uridine-5-carboxymethylaminomethyl(34) synthesis GTPase MnmE [Clostridium sp.]MBP3215429.1 tRNA uridine-5-carboxymethylaminomethyl(34) synthesis GTPase MnmE [Clostridium sp.]
MYQTETIAAIATALSPAGIGIIRISGEDALAVADRVFAAADGKKKLAGQKGYTVHYGHIVEDGEVIDEVLALVMRSPHSYTTENSVEFQCHGGLLVLRRILSAILRNGARMAEPGEFTKRAFLGGRIDLSQAEAVMDLINAKNDYARKSSVRQLSGSLSEKIKDLRSRIIYESAYIESALDDPEHISLEGYPEHLREVVMPMAEEISKLADTFSSGRVLREGIQTVILGKPNAGKSSLMNVLVGEDRAIVTDVEGTTRDTLEEQIHLRGISLNIIDTAGIRETDNIVEKIGVDKARNIVDKADLILYIVDGSRRLDENDAEIIDLIGDRKAIVLLNKSDLTQVLTAEEVENASGRPVLPVSAKEQTGIDALEEKIEEMFLSGEIDFNDELVITNDRHRTALEAAKESLLLVLQSIDEGMTEDFFTVDLLNAYEQLGTIIGESMEDDLADEIFKRFCMGK